MFIVDDGCIYIFALSFVRVYGILACCDVDYRRALAFLYTICE